MKNRPSSTKDTKDTKSERKERPRTPPSSLPHLAFPTSLLSSCSSCPLWILALCGSVLLWASFPPLDWWLLGWVAPIPWVLLIRREKLDGWRPYTVLGLAGFVFWMGVLHFLRLPHWATSFGWVALSFYFAFYLPVFVGLSRVAVHRCRMPVILAAPIVWTGLELVRGHLLSGMSLACLGHTQYRWIELIQVSDLAGAYGVSFVVMLVAASLARMIPCRQSTPSDLSPQCAGRVRRMFSTLAPLLAVVIVLVAVLVYGWFRIAMNSFRDGPRIALIQGSIDAELLDAPDAKTMRRLIEERNDRILRQYCKLSDEAVRDGGRIDLLVWPESMFPQGPVTFDRNAAKPSWFGDSDEDYAKSLEKWAENSREAMAELTERLGVALILGANRDHFGVERQQSYTSAVYVGRDGKILGRYDKVHLVLFGEYMPFVEYAPWLAHFTPLTGSASPGEGPVAFELEYSGARASQPRSRVRIAPSICYESVLSHMIRGQVNALAAEGHEPDLLVNITNDGWFWGSSALDLHLTCGVFRAVECRKPFLVAANTGLSAWIDSDGRIREQRPGRETGIIIAEPRLDEHRRSWYLEHGDWFAGVCLAGCVAFVVVGIRRKKRTQ
jgi:apolipoprotein N-acyltransferase